MVDSRTARLVLGAAVLCNQAASDSSCGECNVQWDSEVAGNLLQDVPAHNDGECCAACDNALECAAWSFENRWYWLRGSCKLKTAYSGSVPSAGLVSGVKRPVRGVRHLDMFRATSTEGMQYTLEDDNMADPGGVLKYVHTETIVEHELGPFRTERKYNVQLIGKWAFQIKNTDHLLCSGMAETSDPDFGPFVTYDFGKSTNPYFDALLPEYGDWVGVQTQEGDPRIDVDAHMWWYSLGGPCPNLDRQSKGSPGAPSRQCMRYRESPFWSNGPTPIAGGLCRGSEVLPTGQPGCVYTYNPPSAVTLDDLAGLTSNDCGGRPCAGWADFRANCSDPTLRRQFGSDGSIQSASYCVEYDIHPTCARNCYDPGCVGLASSNAIVELGVPFWSGRCDAKRNAERKASLLAALSGDTAPWGSKATMVKEKSAPSFII